MMRDPSAWQSNVDEGPGDGARCDVFATRHAIRTDRLGDWSTPGRDRFRATPWRDEQLDLASRPDRRIGPMTSPSSPGARSALQRPRQPMDHSKTERRTALLVTGAGGEMGHGLLAALASRPGRDQAAIVAMDIRELPAHERELCDETIVADVRDSGALDSLFERFDVTEVYHLAAILSSGGERDPERAHEINVGGTFNLLRAAATTGARLERRVLFVYPSTIAVYGLPDPETKRRVLCVAEDQFNEPITMYGCSKLYGEHLGRYYSKHYRLLAPLGERPDPPIDFRSIRFPGIISADTVPTGGTSDYAPEMIHAAAQSKPYACFVRPDSQIPFTTMPEAIEAILSLAAARREGLSRSVYNIRSFSPTAEEFARLVAEFFPESRTTFAPDARRQAIVDSWPADIDDSAARRDFDWSPRHDLRSAFSEYLLPKIAARYS